MGVFDLTHTIRPDMPVFPGTPCPLCCNRQLLWRRQGSGRPA